MIQKTTLAEEIAARIRRKISDGVYPLGVKLPTEPELMNLFGVGRSSVREAVRILANEGYLQVLQGKGTFVLSVSGGESLNYAFRDAKLEELIEVRYLLEGRIVEKAALNRSSEDLERIYLSLQNRKREADTGRLTPCIAADIDFHNKIAEACGNSILAELYSECCKHMQSAFSRLYVDTSVFVETDNSHEELYRAIYDKDVERARATLNTIIERV